MSKRVGIIIVGLLLLGGIVKAAPQVPGLLNRVLKPGSADISFVGVPVEDAQPELVWQLFLPWSKEGLGHGEKYLGEREIGMPVDAEPPGRVVVGPGGIVAVQDGYDERTRLYDREGRFLGFRDGYPLGFTPDGGLITYGPAVRRYGPSGELLWERDPYGEAKKILGVEARGPSELVEGYSTALASPWGDVYCSIRIGRYTAGARPSPEQQGVMLPQWIPVEEFDACVIYDADGKLVRCDKEGIPGGLVFTPRGTAFGAGVPEENAYAHREFDIRDGRFILKRTLWLPNYSVKAVGKDGSVVAKNQDMPTSFTVYKEGSREAVRFVLPDSHIMQVQTDFDGHIYSITLQEDGLLIVCRKWPVPK